MHCVPETIKRRPGLRRRRKLPARDEIVPRCAGAEPTACSCSLSFWAQRRIHAWVGARWSLPARKDGGQSLRLERFQKYCSHCRCKVGRTGRSDSLTPYSVNRGLARRLTPYRPQNYFNRYTPKQTSQKKCHPLGDILDFSAANLQRTFLVSAPRRHVSSYPLRKIFGDVFIEAFTTRTW